MTTFRQFIQEDMSVSNIVDMLKKDCAPWLKEAGKSVMWRGINIKDPFVKKIDPSIYLGAVRNDRVPRDSPKWLHDTLNDYFISKVGIPLRSSSLFCIGSQASAETYNTSFNIFPIGDYNYAWSNLIPDATDSLHIKISEDGLPPPQRDFAELMADEFGSWIKKNHPEYAKELKDSWEYSETKFDDSDYFEMYLQQMSNRYERHQHGYEAFSDEDPVWPPFVKYLINRHNFWKFNAGIKDAIQNQDNEIMLVCDKYYAITPEMTKKVLAKI